MIYQTRTTTSFDYFTVFPDRQMLLGNLCTMVSFRGQQPITISGLRNVNNEGRENESKWESDLAGDFRSHCFFHNKPYFQQDLSYGIYSIERVYNMAKFQIKSVKYRSHPLVHI